MHIPLFSKHLPPNKQAFTLDIDGKVEAVDTDGNVPWLVVERADDVIGGDDMINDEDDGSGTDKPPIPNPFPTKLRLNLRLGYTKELKNSKKIGGTTAAKAEAWLAQVVTQTQVYYKHPSLKTKIVFWVRHKASCSLQVYFFKSHYNCNV